MNEPLAVVLLILVTCTVSFWAFHDSEIEARYIFKPEKVLAEGEYYRLVSSAFLHAGWGHLLLNMYTLYGFGGILCRTFGQWQFLWIYLGSIVGGSLLSLFLHRHHDYAAYGASGGVCGLIFAYVLRFPHHHLALFPLPYTVPGWLYAVGFILASFYALKSGKDNIGHDAHLGGAVIGLLIASSMRPELVREHWIVFLALLLVAGAIFAYLLINPMFLPLSALIEVPSRPWRPGRKRAAKAPVQRQPRPRRIDRAAVEATKEAETDWLIREIEIQVGKLEKDSSGAHDWVDKFGRTYDLIKAHPASFDFASFTRSVIDRLNTPTVKFVIVDTRELEESQVNLVRPFLADLPDDQFNRVIRSFALKPKG